MFTNLRLNMLNKKAASSENKPHEIIKSLEIHDGNIIGDIGAGGGYFTFEFSKKVGKNGRVYAIDTNQKFLTFIESESKKEMINNIKPVLADENELYLPETVNIFFLRNVFHHLTEPAEYFKNIKHFLKDNGKIAIIDYKKEGSPFVGASSHYTPEKIIIDSMKKAGFYKSKKFDFLDNQSFMTFKMK
jgi:ubiquinone/menaquinone biosynthesis C-methylase UbiE